MKKYDTVRSVLLSVLLLLCVATAWRVGHPKTMGELLPDHSVLKEVTILENHRDDDTLVQHYTNQPAQMQCLQDILSPMPIQRTKTDTDLLPYQKKAYHIYLSGKENGGLSLTLNEQGEIRYGRNIYRPSSEQDSRFVSKVEACIASWDGDTPTGETASRTVLDAIEAVRDLGSTRFWYVPNGSTPEEGLQNGPVYHMTGGLNDLLKQNFLHLIPAEADTEWPDTASLCLGDRPDECFRWFLDCDLVVWQEDGKSTLYRTPNQKAGRPDEVLHTFSDCQLDHHQIELPVLKNEAPEDTFARWWKAKRALILAQVPESKYYATGCQLAAISKLRSDEDEIMVRYEMVVQVPPEEVHTTFWRAGKTRNGTGEWDGWLVLEREVRLLHSYGCDHWILTGCATDGIHLTPDESDSQNCPIDSDGMMVSEERRHG